MRSPKLLLACLASVALAACGDDDEDGRKPYQDDGKLTVMTRNLYLGSDLEGVIAAAVIADPDEQAAAFVAAATQAWADVQANDFRARAVELADEIATQEPDLVGLQEATLWRIQDPGDAIFGGTAQAAQVAIDFLSLLLTELDSRGFTYVVARELELSDLEMPVQTGVGTFQDVRLTDRQVILAREGVTVSEAESGVFETLIPLPVPGGGTVPVKRGWTKVKARIGSGDVTFYNTHLEAFDQLGPQFRVVQAAELALILANEPGRVVLVGDLNSEVDDLGDGYQIITTAVPALSDVWIRIGSGDGFTCCFGPDLKDATATLDERIDYVLWKGPLVPESVVVVGEELGDRTASGLWPSDHAGVAATLTLSP